MKKFIHFIWIGKKPPQSLLESIVNKARYLTACWKKFSADHTEPMTIIWTSSELMSNIQTRISQEWEGGKFEIHCVEELFDDLYDGLIILPGEGNIMHFLKWAFFIESTGSLRNLAVATDICKMILLWNPLGEILFVDSGLNFEPGHFKYGSMERILKVQGEQDKRWAGETGTSDHQPGKDTYRLNELASDSLVNSNAEVGLFPAFFRNTRKFFLGFTYMIPTDRPDIQILFSSIRELRRLRELLSPIFKELLDAIKVEKKYHSSSPPPHPFRQPSTIGRDPRKYTFDPKPVPEEEVEDYREKAFKDVKGGVWTGIIMCLHFRYLYGVPDDSKGVYLFRVTHSMEGKKFFIDFPAFFLKDPERQEYTNYRSSKPATLDDKLLAYDEKTVPFSLWEKKRPIPPFPTIEDPTAEQPVCSCGNGKEGEVRPIEMLYPQTKFRGMERPIRCRRCQHTHTCINHNTVHFYSYAGEPIVLCLRCERAIFEENPDISMHLVPRVITTRKWEI